MDIGIRSRVTTGLVAVSVGALVLSPVTPGEVPTGFNWSTTPTVMLTAATQPLPAIPPAPAIQQQPAVSPLNPLTQLVSFNVAFLTTFVTTGAVLFGREFAIPGALLQNIHNGTSAPAGLSQALQTFAQIELQAGRDLVGFAAQYVSFQLNFLTSLASVATMPLAAASHSATSLLVDLNPASTARQSTVQLSNSAPSIRQPDAGTPHLKKVKSAASVGSAQTNASAPDNTNHRRSEVTHTASGASTTSSTGHHGHPGALAARAVRGG
jgi:hypothetical protein